ncbi:MAG: DUF4143 domain-containing protein [Desulfobacterales bacterium]|nr:DUF4143 domain-containing protein [Desulfobacterales bacterium]
MFKVQLSKSFSRAAQGLISLSVAAIVSWVAILYVGFTRCPSDPKVYLWDWSSLEDKGSRAENFIASHLLKAVNWRADNGFGDYRLYFLNDKDKREVDFPVTRNDTPWFMVEAKPGQSSLSKSLKYFHEKIEVPHAFQESFTVDYVNADCFAKSRPTIVQVKTLLSQPA